MTLDKYPAVNTAGSVVRFTLQLLSVNNSCFVFSCEVEDRISWKSGQSYQILDEIGSVIRELYEPREQSGLSQSDVDGQETYIQHIHEQSFSFEELDEKTRPLYGELPPMDSIRTDVHGTRGTTGFGAAATTKTNTYFDLI